MAITPNQQKLVVKYLPVVRRVMKDLNLNYSEDLNLEPDDLFQLGCLALIHAVQRYGDNSNLKNLAYAAVKNKLIDQCRYALRRQGRTFSLNAKVSPDEDTTYQEIIADGGAQKDFEQSAVNSCLEEMVMGKMDQQALTYIKLKMEGFSGREIGKLYGMSHTAVNSRISKQRANAARYLLQASGV